MNEFVTSKAYAAAFQMVPERLDMELRNTFAIALAMHPYLGEALSVVMSVEVDEQILGWKV
jgi:hypothetical protein